MAKKREFNPSNGASRPDAATVGGGMVRLNYVDGYLTDEDKKWLDDNYEESGTLILDFLAGLAEYGGFKCNYEERTGKYLAILYGGQTPETNSGYALTHRGSTPYNTIFVLAYKHMVKLKGRWGGGESPSGGRWD